MGVFSQLLQLIWKNYVLRKRQPIVLLLEIVWPIIIFGIVAIMRTGILPQPQSTCSYHERAMPSAGLIPFLQSSICTLNNPCKTPDQIIQTQASKQKLTSFLADLQPYLTESQILDALEAFQTVEKIFNVLKNVSENATDLDTFREKLKLKNVFNNFDEIYSLLVNDFKVLSDQEARGLLDGTLNIFEILDLFGNENSDFERIVCNVTRLQMYIVFSSSANVSDVSRSLCTIDKNMISNITNIVVRHINVASVINIAADFAAYTGRFDYSAAISDVGKVVEFLLNSPGLMSVFPDLQYLSIIPVFTSKLAAIIPKMEKLQQVDFESINAVVEFIEPIIISTGSDYQVWKTTKDLLAYMQNITNYLNAESVDWSKLFKMAMSVVTELSQGISSDSLNVLIGTNRLLEELYNLTTQLLNGSPSTDMSTGSVNKSIDVMETFLRTVMSEKNVDSFILITDKLVEIMSEITSYYEVVVDAIGNITAPGSAVTKSLLKVFETGSNTPLALIKLITDPENVVHLIQGDMTFTMICLKAVESLSIDEISKLTLRKYVCTVDVASEMESLISRMQSQDLNKKIGQIIVEMGLIYVGFTNPTAKLPLKDLYGNIQNVFSRIAVLTENLTQMIKASFTSIMENNGINSNETDWENIPAQYSSTLIQYNILEMIQSIGSSLQNTTLWPSIVPYLKIIDIVVQHVNDQLVVIKEIFQSNSTMSKLMSITNYIPEITESFLAMVDDQQMMTEILSGKNVMILFCENNIMQRTNLSASVPVYDIERLICTTNWEEIGQKLASIFNIIPVIFKIQQSFIESMIPGTSASYNWTNIVKNVEMISNLFQNSDTLMILEPWYAVIQMNTTRIGESLYNLIVKMEAKVTSGDVSDMTKIGVSALSQLDLTLMNVPLWTYTKHYLTAWNAYAKLFNNLVMKMRDSNLNLTDYVKDLSPTLGKYLEEIVTKTPELIHVMELTARKPEHLLRSIITLDWSRICNGSLINIFVSDGMNLKDFEDGLCQLNWTQITNELLTNDVNIKQYSVQLNYMSMSIADVPDITVNWTDLLEKTKLYLDNMVSLSVSSYWPNIEFPNLHIGNISMSWNDFVSIWNLSDQLYIERLTSITDVMMLLLDMLANSSSPLIVQYKEMVAMETYLWHHIMVFYIEQLKVFNSSIDVNILRYLNSKELNKIIGAENNSAELNYIFIYNILHMIANPQKIPVMLATNYSTVCEDVMALGILVSLPPNSTLDLSTIQSKLCAADINYTALMDDLSNSLPGFKEMVNAFSNVFDGTFDAKTMHINFTTIMDDIGLITNLWSDIRASPPNITLGWSESVLHGLLLQQQWEDAIHKLADSLNGNNLFKIIENSNDLLDTLDNISPEFSKELMKTEFIYRFLEPFLAKFKQLENDSYISFAEFLINSPEAEKVLLLIQKDGVLETLINSVNSQRLGDLIMNLNATDVIVTLCTTDLGTYLSVPSYVILNLTNLQQEFCDINITKLVTELSKKINIVEILDALQNNITVDWKLISSQYARIMSIINRWLENPPTVSIPLRLQDQRVWYQMLITYSESLMDPTIIAREIQCFLERLEPLRREEPMRQFAMFLETFLALVDMNMTTIQSTNLTLNDLANSIPGLRDIFSSLDLRPDVLDSMLHTSIVDQKLLIEIFTSLDIVSELCSNELFWNSTINISNINTTEVQNGFCKLKNSSKVVQLLQGLNFTEFLQGLNKTNIIPDWKTILTESLELSNVISSLVNNSNIPIDLLQALSRLQSMYDTGNLLNLLSFYTVLSTSFKGNESNNIIDSDHWQMFSSYVQSVEIIAKLINNMISEMNPMDDGIQWALLFTNTSRVRSLLESLPNMNEDLINRLLLARINPRMGSTILALISNTTNMTERICNEKVLPDCFDFNASMMIEFLCKANESQVIEELMEMVDISKVLQLISGKWNSSENSDIHNFMQLIHDLSDTFARVVNATDIDLGSFTALLNINVTKMEELFMAEFDNLAMKYPNISSQLLEPLFFDSLLRNGTFPTDFVLAMLMMNTRLNDFQTRLSKLIDAPINISTLLHNTELSMVLNMVLNRPDLIDDLINVAIIQPAKLWDLLANVSDPKSVLCNGSIAEIITAPVNSSFWLIYEDLCAINGTLLFWESLSSFSLQYQQIQLLDLLVQMKNELKINETGITQYSIQLLEMLMTLLSNSGQNNATMSSLNTSSFQSILESLGLSLTRQYGALIQQWSSIALQFLGQVPSKEVSKYIMTFEVILKFMNRQLKELQGNITMDQILRGDTDLKNMIDSVVRLINTGTSEYLMNGSINIDALLQMANPDIFMGLCKNGTLSEFITKSGTNSSIAHDLEKILCVYPKPFWQALQNRTETNILQQQLSEIWNDTYTGAPDWLSLNKTIVEFSTLMSGLLSDPMYVDDKIINLLDFNVSLESAVLFFRNPVRIFDSLSQLGFVLNYSWLPPAVITSFDTSVRIMMELLTEFQASGKSVEEYLLDPYTLSKLMLKLTHFDDQLRIFLVSYTNSIFEIAGRIDFYQQLVCNETLLNMLDETISPFGVHMSVISNALCRHNASDWYNNLLAAGFSQTDIMKFFTLLIGSNSTAATEMLMGPLSSMGPLNLVQTLMDMLSGRQLGNLSNILHMNMTWVDYLQVDIVNKSLSSFVNILKLLDSGSMSDKYMFLDDIMGFFKMFGFFEQYIRKQIEVLSAMGWNVPLNIFLPNSTLIAQLLTDAIGAQSAAALLTATIHPEKFFTLALSINWTDIVCNETKFSQTFMFPVGINVSSLQKDLCENIFSHESAIGEILQKVDMMQVLSVLNNWISMNSNISSSNGTITWDDIRHQSVILVDNINRLFENGSSNFTKWLEPILIVFNDLFSPSIQSMGHLCDWTLEYIKGTDYYWFPVLPTVEAIYNGLKAVQMQISLQDVIKNVACGNMSQNLTSVIQNLMANGVQYKIKELMDMYTGSMSGSNFTCTSMVQYSNEISTLFSKSLTQWVIELQDIGQCVTKTYMSSIEVIQNLQRLFSAGGELLQILKDPDFFKISTSIDGNDQLRSIMEYVIGAFLQQQKVTEEIRESIKKNMTSIDDFLQQTLQLATNALNVLFVFELKPLQENFTADAIATVFCDPETLKKVVRFPDFINVSYNELSSQLCGLDIKTTSQIAAKLAELARLAQMLQGLQSNWWYNVINDFSTFIKDIQGLSDLVGLLNQIKSIDFSNIGNSQTLLSTIQRLLVDSGPDDLIDSFNALLQNFETLSPDKNATMDIFADVQMLMKGLLGLKSIRSLIISNIEIADLIKDKDEFKTFLMKDLGLNETVVDAVLDGALSFEMLLNSSRTDVFKEVCNSTELEKLIILNSSRVNVHSISEALCSLDRETIVNLTEAIIVRLDIGDLIEEMISKGFTSFLLNAGVTLNESKEAVGKITTPQDDFTIMLNILNNQTSIKADFIAALAEAQTGLSIKDAALSVSSLLCGSGDIVVDDSFNLNAAIGNDGYTLTDSQVNEMMSLPGEFCRNLFKEIMKTEGGPIIWGYLKPVMRGKILYTPDTPITRKIMQKINDTFEMLESVYKIAKKWAAGSESLQNLYGSKETQDQLQKILSDRFIQSFLAKIAGLPTKELQNSLNAFNNTDPLMIKSLYNAARLIENYTSCLEMNRFVPVPSEDLLDDEGVKFKNRNEFLSGLVFINVEDMPTGRRKRQLTTDIPKHIQYKLRMDIDNVPQTERLEEWFWRPIPEDNFEEDLRYLRGFVQLQDMIERAIISLHTGQDVTSPGLSLKQFPFPCHKRDDFVSLLSSYILPLLMTIAYIAGVAIAVRNFVSDREDGQEQTLQIMGMRSFINWWAWFLSTMTLMALVTLFVIIILRYGNLLKHSDFGILYLYILAFCFSTIMLCYFVSAFFTRTTMAMLTVLIVYLISYLPFIVLISIEAEFTFWQKTLTCLFSTSAFGWSGQYLTQYEEQLVGLQWSNIASSPINGDPTSFSWTCSMMVIDGAIYAVLGWYIRHVKPGKFGVSQPWYFLFSPEFWGCIRPSSVNKNKTKINRIGYLREPVDAGLREALSARGLSKIYSKKQGAVVDNVNISIYSGHVTVMLGHNGAAKTSLINMLIGILKPSQGEVLINNRPQQKAKHSLGICPQHNSLFPYMTVIEHMEFYAAIKSNRSGTAVKDEINQLLRDVGMWNVRHTPVKHLSGGMKRRLCVALAFVGGSEVVILDEPTSGIDPNGRRAIWNLIIRRKNGCAILLSTHHLDEADILGDRIIMMHKGKILCSGSSLFLKQSVGSGYRLIVAMKMQNDNQNVRLILALLQARFPYAKLVKVVNNEYTFILPIQSRYDEFECFFIDLETNKEILNISEYALSGPTLDEVFLKVSSVADMGQPLTPENIRAVMDDSLKSLDLNGERGNQINEKQQKVTTVNTERKQRRPPKATGCALKSQQLGALISKRFHHYRRDWRMIVSVLLLPTAMFAAALGLHAITPDYSQARNLLLTPPMYGPNSYVFVSDPVEDPLTGRVIDMFTKDPGIGTTCMNSHKPLGFPFECIQGDSAFTKLPYTARPNATCRCDDYHYMCDEGAEGIPPPQRRTITTDILQNISGYNIEKYLLDSFFKFTEKRYGGWSFERETDLLSTSNLTAKVWFNNKGYHAMPAFVNALNNALLRVNVELHLLGKPAEYGITAYNHPITFNRRQLSKQTLVQDGSNMALKLFIICAFTLVPLGLILFVLNENSNKERHLLRVGGVGTIMYWMTSFIWDLVMYCLPVALAFALLAIFRLNSFWVRENAAAVIALLLLYGWALLPMMYTGSKLFKEGSTAYFTMFSISVSIAISSLVCVFLLNFFQPSLAIKNAYTIVKYVFLIFPPFSLGEGLIMLTENQIQSEIFARFGTDSYKSPFSFDLIAWNLVAMAIEGFVFFIILFYSEARCEMTRYIASLTWEERLKEDKDVSKERLRVQAGYTRHDVLILKDLSKVFKRNNASYFAVDHLNFGVPKGQCFGLLGFNGAGKTTTFQMLTGDITPSGGIAQVLNKSIRHCDSSIGVNIGYCPQVDALDRFLTISELLYCHASIKGIPSPHIKMAVEKVMSSLRLNSIRNKVIKTCSGGTKRKVSLAIALIGDPPVILLDEPTTGMDPASKRLTWNCLQAALQKGQSILLTSHSMEECDILCDKLAIMVNGQLKCMGSPQRLKYKFGEGYTVKLYMSGLSTSQDRLHEFINIYFPGVIKRIQSVLEEYNQLVNEMEDINMSEFSNATMKKTEFSLKSHHQNVVQLDIPRETARISQIFRALEREKYNYNIMYYTVSQTTLETIFLNIARDQGDESISMDGESSSQSKGPDEMVYFTNPLIGKKYGYMNATYERVKDVQFHPTIQNLS